MLCSLSNRRKALRIEQSKIDNQFIRFMNELQHSLQNDEDLTVILADTFSAPVENMKNVADIEKEEKTTSPSEEQNHYPQKPPRSTTPPLESSSRAGRFACFAGGVFGDDTRDQESSADFLRSALTNPEFGQFRCSQEADPEASRLFPSSSHPSPSAMRAGAQAWREQQGRAAATEGINFRTGMSGHMALLSTHAHAHEYLGPNSTRSGSNSNRMSSHSGLTMSKAPSLHGILSSLTLPVIGTPPRQQNNDGPIHHTGSM